MANYYEWADQIDTKQTTSTRTLTQETLSLTIKVLKDEDSGNAFDFVFFPLYDVTFQL